MKKTLITIAMGVAALMAQAEARYVFYFIGDGMGLGHVNATLTYLRQNDPEASLLMTQFPVASTAMTYSASSPITDSAAAGTALSTGVKTNNGMVGMNPDEENIYSIARAFQNAGYAVGVASSVAVDDATPAAFYGHVPVRKDYRTLADQALESGYNFLGGPLFRGMTSQGGERREWFEALSEAGYDLRDGFGAYRQRAPRADRLMLLSNHPQGDQIGFTIDSIPDVLTLQQITIAGLNQLQRVSGNNGDKGFFMMVEGGNIDWGAHANDGATVIKEIINFQESIDVAYRFYLAHPEETLIVVTADHDTGGMALGRYGNEKDIRLDYADYQKISKDRFSDYCKARLAAGNPFTWEEMKTYLQENFGFFGPIDITDAELAEMKDAFDLTFVKNEGKDVESLYNSFNHFAVMVYDIMNRKMGVAWTTGYHTGNLVPVYAVGEGADLFKKMLNNVEIPALILEAAGLKE